MHIMKINEFYTIVENDIRETFADMALKAVKARCRYGEFTATGGNGESCGVSMLIHPSEFEDRDMSDAYEKKYEECRKNAEDCFAVDVENGNVEKDADFEEYLDGFMEDIVGKFVIKITVDDSDELGRNKINKGWDIYEIQYVPSVTVSAYSALVDGYEVISEKTYFEEQVIFDNPVNNGDDIPEDDYNRLMNVLDKAAKEIAKHI